MGADATRLKRILGENRAELVRLEGSLVSAARGRDMQAIYVTSARPREGKTTAAASIAHGLCMAHEGEVVLVEGNTRAPAFHELFDVARDAPGLTDFLASKAGLEDVVVRGSADAPAIIPCGTGHGAGLGMAAFKERLRDLRDNFRYVVFDGDAVFSSSAPALQAPFFNGTVLVVECGETKWEVVNLARRTLADAGAVVLGVVLNRREYAIPAGLYQKV